MSDYNPFISYQESQRIDSLPEDDFNALPFGAIKLDVYGNILKYNLYESKLAERNPAEVIGLNFFTDVAPCTNVQEFAGRYRQGMADRNLNIVFPYRFVFPKRVVDVEITLILCPDGQSAWVFVKDSSGAKF